LRKLIDFKGLVDEIKLYAYEHCEGNFNLAVRQLIKKGLSNE
jgi:hypothetical protein